MRRPPVGLPVFAGLLALTLCSPAWAEHIPCTPEPTNMTIAYGQTIGCQLEVQGDSDAYRFEGVAGEVVLIIDKSTPDPCFELIAPDNTRTSRCGIGANSSARIDTRLTRTGTHTILVRSTFGQPGPYVIVLERLLPPSSNAPPLAYGGTVTGQLEPSGDVDVFSFIGTGGTSVLIELRTFDPCLEIVAPDNTRTTRCGIGAPSTIRIDAVLVETGTYTVVAGSMTNSQGPFSLTLQCLTGPCGCLYTLQPASASFPVAGGAATVEVTTTPACPWTAASSVPWVTIVSGATGIGSGVVSYSVDANIGDARMTDLAIATRAFRVSQAALIYTRYLAEGATGPFFDTHFALLNTEPTATTASMRFLKQDGSVVTHSVPVNARSRATIDPETIAGLAHAAFSTVVESSVPLIVDRTTSWDAGGYGAHAETSVAGPALTWYLAEGSTSGDFALFYLIQNPTTSALTATVTYLRPSGQPPIVRSYPLPPSSRTTILVDDQGPELASTDVSAVVSAPQPIIVERAMYMTRAGQVFAAGHESAGVTTPATSWFLAEGATGPFFDLFILLANPTNQAAEVTVDYLLLGGTTFAKSYSVPANGRFTIWVDSEEIPAGSGVKPLDNVAVSSTITSTNGVPIIVERSMWWPSPALTADFWTEAHNSPGATAPATRWGLAEGEVGGPRSAETYILIANTSAFGGNVRVTLFFEDGTTVVRAFGLLPRSRTNVSVLADFPAAAGKRFGAVVESIDQTPVQIVVERAMYTSPGGVTWVAGTNALATRLSP